MLADDYLPKARRDFVEADYEVVLAIISRSTKALNLPFFSVLNILAARRQLNAYGFRLSIAKIQTIAQPPDAGGGTPSP